MDQDVILGGGRKTFAIRNKIFQLFCAFAAAQLTPDGIAKGNHRAQMGFGEFGLEGGQFINENFAGRAQGIHIPFDVGFNPNRRAAMFWQNATLNLRHRSSWKKDATTAWHWWRLLYLDFSEAACSGANYCFQIILLTFHFFRVSSDGINPSGPFQVPLNT